MLTGGTGGQDSENGGQLASTGTAWWTQLSLGAALLIGGLIVLLAALAPGRRRK